MLPAFARTGLRAASMPRPMMASTSSRVTQQLAVRRSYATDRTGQRGDAKAKLAFRFGLKDVPVELYPMFVVVVAACLGGAYAVGRHFYLDNLRLLPSGFSKKPESSEH